MNPDFLIVLLVIIAVGILGVWAGIRMTLHAFENMEAGRLRDLIRELRDGEDVLNDLARKVEIMPLTFSAADDLILAYNARTGEFVSQGKDNEEMLLAAIERFPDRFFVLGSETLGKDQV